MEQSRGWVTSLQALGCGGWEGHGGRAPSLFHTGLEGNTNEQQSGSKPMPSHTVAVPMEMICSCSVHIVTTGHVWHQTLAVWLVGPQVCIFIRLSSNLRSNGLGFGGLWTRPHSLSKLLSEPQGYS